MQIAFWERWKRDKQLVVVRCSLVHQLMRILRIKIAIRLLGGGDELVGKVF